MYQFCIDGNDVLLNLDIVEMMFFFLGNPKTAKIDHFALAIQLQGKFKYRFQSTILKKPSPLCNRRSGERVQNHNFLSILINCRLHNF